MAEDPGDPHPDDVAVADLLVDGGVDPPGAHGGASAIVDRDPVRAAPPATIARATQPMAGNPGITARNSKATAAGGTATSSREISICLGAVPQSGRHG